MPAPHPVRRPPTLAIVSKEAHAKGLVEALRKAGVEPVMLGGAVASVPDSIDVILYRTASAAHTSQPTLAAWGKQKGKTLIQGNGSSRLIKALRAKGLLPADAPVPAPAPVLTPIPAPGTAAARCYDALRDGPLVMGEIALRLGMTNKQVSFAVHKDPRIVNRYPAAEFKRRYGLMDYADRTGGAYSTLEETQKRGRKAAAELKKRAKAQEAEAADTMTCAVCLGMGPLPGRDDAIRCEKHEGHKRCAVPNRTDGKPCDRFIDADEVGCWHHKGGVAPAPNQSKAPAPADADDPTATIRDEAEFIVLWMREWNVTGITISAGGAVTLSDEPRKTAPHALRFKVEPPRN
jgi:hypothetical protein